MQYQVLNGTHLYKRLRSASNYIKHCNAQAIILGKKYGFLGIIKRREVLAGGISAFVSNIEPVGFYAVNNVFPGWYPDKNKQNKQLLSQMEALPVVRHSYLNNILNYSPNNLKPDPIEGEYILKSPMVLVFKHLIVVKIPDSVNYQPHFEMSQMSDIDFIKLLQVHNLPIENYFSSKVKLNLPEKVNRTNNMNILDWFKERIGKKVSVSHPDHGEDSVHIEHEDHAQALYALQEKSNYKFKESHAYKDSDEDDSSSFGTSLAWAAITDSAAVGMIAGGDIAGSLLGEAIADSFSSDSSSDFSSSDSADFGGGSSDGGGASGDW